MPGFGVRDHQVARHPVAVHGELRLGQRAGDQLIAGRRPDGGLGARPGDAALARDAPFGKERELAPQQRVVVRRQRGARDVALPAHERGDGVAHQGVGAGAVAARLRVLQRVEVELAAEIVEQEKAVADVGLEHARRVQAGGGDQSGDVDERPHVFLRRRRVHHHQAGAVAAVDAEVAAKAGVARRRAQARDDQAVARGARRRARPRTRARAPAPVQAMVGQEAGAEGGAVTAGARSVRGAVSRQPRG